MRVRALGPFEVLTGAGTAVPLGTPKQRTMCALLTMRADQLVTLDEIVDELWGDRPPRSAVANVRTYTSNLRHILVRARVDGLRLDTRGPGYVLRVEPSTFDLHEFREAVRGGRAAAARGDLAGAAARFAAGLALWHGEPLEDVPLGAALTARCVALRDERASTVEAAAEAALGLGRADAVVPQLREHVHVWPTRERGWELLMAALHRCGDVAGALSAYASARSALVEHLGVEPGPRLTELHQTVLRGAPVTLPAPAARTVVPAQLPLGTAAFAGRDRQLAELDAILADRTSTVVISAIARYRRRRQDRAGGALGSSGGRDVRRWPAVREPARVRPERIGDDHG